MSGDPLLSTGITLSLRRADRFVFRDPIPCSITLSGAAELLDLSLAGARVRTSTTLPVGAWGLLIFSIDGVRVEVSARVVWSNPISDSDGSDSGVEFVQLPLALEPALLRLCEL